MKNYKFAILNIFLAASFLGGYSPAAFGQELSAAEEALIEAQAQRHVERYYNYYFERNPEALATEIFTSPWYIVGANGITAYASE